MLRHIVEGQWSRPPSGRRDSGARAMRGLAGKCVLVSGGSSGIGAATARRFLEEGARVHLGGLAAAEVDAAVSALSDLGEVTGEATDVSEETGATRLVDGAVARLGAIDVLANNA